MKRFFAALAATEYNHIKFRGGLMTLRGLIWGLWGGFAAGLLITFYHKAYLGELIRRLLSREAYSKVSAMTLSELGMKPVWLLTRALKRGGSLMKYAAVANPDECEAPNGKARGRFEGKLYPERDRISYDFSAMKLYIPEDKKYVAEVRYGEKKKISPLWLAVFLVALTALAVGLTIAIPELLKMIDNAITQYFDK